MGVNSNMSVKNGIEKHRVLSEKLIGYANRSSRMIAGVVKVVRTK
jgi:hypothetical protein